MDASSTTSKMALANVAIMSNCDCATTSMLEAKMPFGTYTMTKTKFTAIIGDDP